MKIRLAVTLSMLYFAATLHADNRVCYSWQESVWNEDTATLDVIGHEMCFGGDDPPPPPDEPPGPGASPWPWDDNSDGTIDDWTLVTETQDPCGQNFDWGDRLGSDYGGPNSADAPAGESGRPGHNGVDIQANAGDRINSMQDGIVERVGDDGTGCGYSVRIGHFDGSSATYCHMEFGSADDLVVDNAVMAGQPIGSAGGTGSANGAIHLHLIYRDSNGNYDEFFNHVNTTPQSWQLDSTGC